MGLFALAPRPLTRLNPVIDFTRGIGLEIGFYGPSTPASAVWPSANRAILVPMYLSDTTLVPSLFADNGATAAGNLDLGIYTEGFARIVSKGSTAQSGTDAPQSFDITDVTLAPGRYYLALASDSASATFLRYSVPVYALKAMGVLQMTSAFPLPATITPEAVASAYVPFAGLVVS